MRVIDYVELQYVHPLLSATVLRAAMLYREHHGLAVRVTDGYRTNAEQDALRKAGKSRVKSSFHQVGLAVDLAICQIDGSACNWEFSNYQLLDLMMRAAFRDINPDSKVTLLWGGKWVSLKDGVHWQLQGIESTYPDGSALTMPQRPA